MDYLLIDGYNIINAWRDIFNLNDYGLEDSREKFLDMISNYEGFSKQNIIVVFDAHMVEKRNKEKIKHDNITVVFTEENQTADNFIERFVYLYSDEYRITVATSDYLEQTMVLRNGGTRMTPEELRSLVDRISAGMTGKYSKKPERDRNSISTVIKPGMLEKFEKMRRGEL